MQKAQVTVLKIYLLSTVINLEKLTRVNLVINVFTALLLNVLIRNVTGRKQVFQRYLIFSSCANYTGTNTVHPLTGSRHTLNNNNNNNNINTYAL